MIRFFRHVRSTMLNKEKAFRSEIKDFNRKGDG